MNRIFNQCVLIASFLLLGHVAHSDNLNVSVNHAMDGGSTGEIFLTIEGGMAPFVILWTGPGGYTSTSTTLTGLVAGTYHVVVEDSYCGKAEMDVVVEAKSTSVETHNSLSIKVFPNPTSQSLTLNMTKTSQYDITMVNVLGQKVWSQSINAKEHVCDISQLQSGIYMLYVKSSEGEFIEKIVKL